MDATIKGAGLNENVEAQVDPTYQALRSSIRPLDHVVNGVVGGHYGIVAYSGAVVASQTAATILFACRFVSQSKLMVLKSLKIGHSITTAYTTLSPPDFELVLAKSFTVMYTNNAGTVLTPAAYSNKARTQMAGSEFVNSAASGNAPNMTPCTTSGMSSGQTVTLDTYPFAYAPCPVPGVAIGSGGTHVLYEQTQMGKHPIIIGNNEGFVIRFANTSGATGVSKLGIALEWAEVAAY